MTNLEGKIGKTVGNTYGLRTWIEYGFKHAKNELGWTDYRVTDYASHALTLPKRGLLVPEGEEVDWETLVPPGFRPQPKRWLIERCFSWMVRGLRLCRDHEGLPQSSEAFIKLSASYRMLITLVTYYNQQRPHQSLNYSTPAEVYFAKKREEETP